MTNPVTETTPKPRGFQRMTPERRAEIARMGGKSIAPDKRAFSQNRELASRAGKIGGASKKES